MNRTHIAALLFLLVAIPAAAAAYFTSGTTPCFNAGAESYRISDSDAANVTVRIDNTAAKPDLRLQLIDDMAAADFVLVDDRDTVNACSTDAAVRSIRLDPAAARADLTVTLSRAPAAHKLYVHSANFSEQDAAALFAVIWESAGKDARRLPAGREVAARD